MNENNPTVSPQTTADEETQLRYAITRLQIHVVDTNALAQYRLELLQDDVRLVLEALRVTRDDLTAAWANGKKIKEENARLRQLLQDAMDVSWTGDDDAIEIKKRIYAALRGEGSKE